MLAAQVTAPDVASLVDLASPVPGPDKLLVEVAAAGICGTDIHIYHGEYDGVYPIVPGHEFSGTVVDTGADVSRFRPGDRVTADPNIACGRCEPCRRGQLNQCTDLSAIGVHRPGAFAERVVVPAANALDIGTLAFSAAAAVEPLACVVWGLKRVDVQQGDSVLIFGAGPMGCLMVQAVRAAGAAKVVAADIAKNRLDLAGQLGAAQTIINDGDGPSRIRAIEPDGFDVVADVTGHTEVVQQAFDHVRPRGKVWIFGVCPPDETAAFVPFDVFRKDLSIIGSFALSKTAPESLAMIQSGAVQVEPLISHTLPLDRFTDALHLAEHAPDRMKIQLTP